jgi:hypothetical protein
VSFSIVVELFLLYRSTKKASVINMGVIAKPEHEQ